MISTLLLTLAFVASEPPPTEVPAPRAPLGINLEGNHYFGSQILFVDAMKHIAEEIEADASSLAKAPRAANVERLDIVAADRKPVTVFQENDS